MASASGDRVEALAASLDLQAVTDPSANDAPDDLRLVEAARQGDRAAFGRLYDRYARMVHGILLARVPLNEGDDMVHAAFLLPLRQPHTLPSLTPFRPWLA